jgi:hypothetical protein
MNAQAVVDFALNSLDDGEEEPLEVRDSDAEKIYGAITCLRAEDELRYVAQELLKIAHFADVQKQSRKASKIMIALAGYAARLMGQLKDKLQGLGEEGLGASRRYKSFKADRATLAPKVGAAKPKNSISVDRLHPMRRV